MESKSSLDKETNNNNKELQSSQEPTFAPVRDYMTKHVDILLYAILLNVSAVQGPMMTPNRIKTSSQTITKAFDCFIAWFPFSIICFRVLIQQKCKQVSKGIAWGTQANFFPATS